MADDGGGGGALLLWNALKFTATQEWRDGLLIVFARHDLWLFIFNGVGRHPRVGQEE